MRRQRAVVHGFLLLFAELAAAAPASAAGAVDEARLKAADTEPQNWFTGGRDKDGTYYSPLTTINADNIKDLGFAWSYDLGSPQRGQEATPIVVDGVMYTSGTWGYVYALDAATGKRALALRSEARRLLREKSMLRPRQPRRRRLEGQSLCRLESMGGCMR